MGPTTQHRGLHNLRSSSRRCTNPRPLFCHNIADPRFFASLASINDPICPSPVMPPEPPIRALEHAITLPLSVPPRKARPHCRIARTSPPRLPEQPYKVESSCLPLLSTSARPKIACGGCSSCKSRTGSVLTARTLTTPVIALAPFRRPSENAHFQPYFHKLRRWFRPRSSQPRLSHTRQHPLHVLLIVHPTPQPST